MVSSRVAGWAARLCSGLRLALIASTVAGRVPGAALIVGFVTWAVPIGVPLQIVLFALLAIVAVFTGRRYLRSHPVEAADPKMNQRGERVIGEMVVVTQAIEGGSGKVKLGDSEWLARGADAAPGTRLRVAGHDGVVLIVEAP